MAIPPVRLDPWQNITAVSWKPGPGRLLRAQAQFKSLTVEGYNFTSLQYPYGDLSFLSSGLPGNFLDSIRNGKLIGQVSLQSRSIDPDENEGFDRECTLVIDMGTFNPNVNNEIRFRFFTSPYPYSSTADMRAIYTLYGGEGISFGPVAGTVYAAIESPPVEATYSGRASVDIVGEPSSAVVETVTGGGTVDKTFDQDVTVTPEGGLIVQIV